MSIRQALDLMLSVYSRQVTLNRVGNPTNYTIKISPSSYTRDLEGLGSVRVEGREFVITKTNIVNSTFPLPLKRGDRITDSEFGTVAISEVKEMLGLNGETIGYRVRTS